MIDIKQFYLIGGVLMLLSVLGQIWNLSVTWDILTMGARISQIAGGVLFSSLLTTFFLGLWYKTPKTPSIAEVQVNSEELDKLIKEMSDDGGPDEGSDLCKS